MNLLTRTGEIKHWERQINYGLSISQSGNFTEEIVGGMFDVLTVDSDTVAKTIYLWLMVAKIGLCAWC